MLVQSRACGGGRAGAAGLVTREVEPSPVTVLRGTDFRRLEPLPFHDVPGSASQLQRRLLLISYHFPPGQAVGALRWQKFARHVAERGWGLDVITLDPSSHLRTDQSRLEDLPPGTCVYGIRATELWISRMEDAAWRLLRRLRPRQAIPERPAADTARAAASKGSASCRPTSLGRHELQWRFPTTREFLRAYYAGVDFARDAAWARRAAAVAMRVVKPGVHDAVITCGPPHMANHEAGRLVSLETTLPLVVDMRDPWSLVQRLPEYVASPVWLQLAARAERCVVAHAALVVANTEPARLALRAAYPDASHRIITVTNGYDEEQVPPSRHNERFTIAYAGTIYLDRDPRLLFRAAARVVREFGLGPSRFGIDFIGNAASYGGVAVDELARQEGLEGFVTVGPPRPRREAMHFLADATVLVSLPQDSDMAIPSKIFEYMPFNAWLLALADRGSATELLLRDTDADVVAPDDVDGVARALRERYRQHAAGVRPTALAAIRRFSRRAQAELLLDALEECIRQRPSRPTAAPSVPAAAGQ